MSDPTNDNTTDCPICLCPIPSEPWGVCTPCGHPYHRECWNQVVASHAASGTGGNGRRGKRKNASCAICNGATRGFVPVFLDLGNHDDDSGGGEVAMAKSGGDNGVIDLDGDENNELVEELVDEWDRLWQELKILCACVEDANENEGRGNSADAGDVIDVTDSISDRYVADICATIDLTQHSPPQPEQVQSQTQSSSSDQGLAATELEQFQRRQGRIQKILQRLKCIHDKILSIQQSSTQHSSSPSSNNRKMQRLKSKVLNLQSTNTNLSSQTKSLQTTNDGLTTKFDKLQETVLERTIECERSKSQHSTLQTQFRSMEDSYQKHICKSTLVRETLQDKIAKLQSEFQKMQTQAGLDDVKEMDEIRRNYSKMSQEVHDVKGKNARLETESKRKDREWEVRCGREKEKCEGLKHRLERLLESSGSRGTAKCGGLMEGGGRLGEEEGSVEDDTSFTSWYGKARGSSVHFEAAAAHRKTASSTKTNFDRVRSKITSLGRGEFSTKASADEASSASEGNTKKQATRLQTASSSTKTNGSVQRSSKAMDALDRASSRKFTTQLKRPHQREHQRQSSLQSTGSRVGTAAAAEGQQQASDNASTDGVQLMMRTASRSSKKRRHGGSSSNISNAKNDEDISGRKGSIENREQEERGAMMSESTSSKSAKKTNRVSAEVRKKGNISSFFKPVINLDV
mmetsp:Transcript_20117/g.36352  ORF Transcript_20117/g.36352 Transcript_20117/m.36352 type:complete len:688 (-) Transcript_20117:1681-3744(-)